MNHVCSKCNESKNVDYFNKNKRNKNGISDWCKSCNRNYREANQHKIKKQQANYRKENRQYYKDYGREYHKRKLATDPKYKLAHCLRVRVSDALFSKRWNKSNTLKNYLGCSLDQLIEHLENLFVPGMTWENHGDWHIDHIMPLSSAKSPQNLYDLCHYKNLQPLWKIDNISKGSRF